MPRKPKNLQLHNLCRDQSLVTDDLIETLGMGLGHGVALEQQEENPIDMERLRRAVRMQFTAGMDDDDDNDDGYNPKFYCKSKWEPGSAPTIVESAMDDFEDQTNIMFSKARKPPTIFNMKKQKTELLRRIKKDRKLMITATDKGLGPAIMEIDVYINRALDDHLDNKSNYKELEEREAVLINETNFRWICERFLDHPDANTVTAMEQLFFERTLFGKRDKNKVMQLCSDLQLPYFYLLPKVHKKPWATRPVVSGVSSVMEPLSKWVDIQLQRVVHLCPAYTMDSWQFLNDIKDLQDLNGYTLVTADAKAMYCNINTDHAIDTMRKWFQLHKHELPLDFPHALALESIERLMKYNVFTFGSRFFIQENGTAMGTNAACMYATIYYSYHEETRIVGLDSVIFYRRLIDDAFIIIRDNKDDIRELDTVMQDFGPIGKRLEWEFTKPSSLVDFLDLTVSITSNGKINTKTFQKAMNLYLYRCPSSAQPPTILYSLIYGTLHRYYWQNTHIQDFGRFTELFFERLTERAHKRCDLAPLFLKAAQEVENSTLPNPRPGQKKENKVSNNNNLFIHLPYHPQQPSRSDIRDHATALMSTLKEEKDCFERIILAFSRAPNIGDLCKKHRLEATIDTGAQ